MLDSLGNVRWSLPYTERTPHPEGCGALSLFAQIMKHLSMRQLRKLRTELAGVKGGDVSVGILDLDKADTHNTIAIICNIRAQVFRFLDTAYADIFQREMLGVNDVAAVVVDQAVILDSVTGCCIRGKAAVYFILAVGGGRLVCVAGECDCVCCCCLGDCRKAVSEFSCKRVVT